MSTNSRHPPAGGEQTRLGRAEVATAVAAAPRLGTGKQVRNFARHFLEMCVVMCIAGSVLRVLVLSGAMWAGYDLRDKYPEIALVVIAALYTAPMSAWMRFRGMGWRPNLEMSGATIGLAVAVVGLTWLGALPESSLATWQVVFCGPACIVMFVVMLFRLDVYTGRSGQHGG